MAARGTRFEKSSHGLKSKWLWFRHSETQSGDGAAICVALAHKMSDFRSSSSPSLSGWRCFGLQHAFQDSPYLSCWSQLRRVFKIVSSA